MVTTSSTKRTKRTNYAIYMDSELMATVDVIVDDDPDNNRSKFIEHAVRRAVDEYPLDEVEEAIKRRIDRDMERLDRIRKIK